MQDVAIGETRKMAYGISIISYNGMRIYNYLNKNVDFLKKILRPQRKSFSPCSLRLNLQNHRYVCIMLMKKKNKCERAQCLHFKEEKTEVHQGQVPTQAPKIY